MFEIQASNPRFINESNDTVEGIGDAIEAIFPLHSEFAVIRWNYIPILLSYKYDISIIIDDVLRMLKKVRCEDKGTISIRWPSNTFASTWYMEWQDGNISITAEWESVIGHTESLLNSKKSVVICTESFLIEWKKLLYNVIQALNSCGYKKEQLEGLTELHEEFEAITKYGVLYE